MGSQLSALVARRERLVRRLRSRRTELEAITGRLRGDLRGVETLFGAVQSFRRTGALIGVVAAAAAVAAVGPGRLLRNAPRLLRLAPIALSVYDVLRRGRDRQR